MKQNTLKPVKAWIVASPDGWSTEDIFPLRKAAQDYYSRVKMPGTRIVSVLITPIEKPSKINS
jgi:hypothetical protein